MKVVLVAMIFCGVLENYVCDIWVVQLRCLWEEIKSKKGILILTDAGIVEDVH